MFLVRARSGLLIVALVSNLVLAGGLGAGKAHACSCAGSASLEEQVSDSAAVFSGEVLDIEENELAPGPGPPLGRVTFDVRASWKGVSGGSVVVYGQGDEVSCGIDFQEGQSYLVFAYGGGEGHEDPLQTDFCTQTQQLSTETATQRLGPPTATLPDTGGSVSLKELGFLVVAIVTNLVL
jgi:hypothetical protein